MSDTKAPAVNGSRGRRRAVLLYLLVFCCGLVAGAGLAVIVVRHEVQKVIGQPDLAIERLGRLISRRLRLTSEQETQIRDILSRRRAALKGIRARFQPQVEAELARISGEVEEVLTPAQRKTWGRMVNRFGRWRPTLPQEPVESKGVPEPD